MVIVCLYVDDLIYTGNDITMCEKFKQLMMREFDITDLGNMHYFLGIEVVQSETDIFISQKKYVQEILNKFHMSYCNPVATPTEVGFKLIRNPDGMSVDSHLYKKIVRA